MLAADPARSRFSYRSCSRRSSGLIQMPTCFERRDASRLIVRSPTPLGCSCEQRNCPTRSAHFSLLHSLHPSTGWIDSSSPEPLRTCLTLRVLSSTSIIATRTLSRLRRNIQHPRETGSTLYGAGILERIVEQVSRSETARLTTRSRYSERLASSDRRSRSCLMGALSRELSMTSWLRHSPCHRPLPTSSDLDSRSLRVNFAGNYSSRHRRVCSLSDCQTTS